MILDGFLLSFNEKYVEFFNVRGQRVVKMADTATDRNDLQLGNWYRFKHNKIEPFDIKGKSENMKVYLPPFSFFNSYVVCAHVVGYTPSKGLRADVYNKYQKQIWSPYLGYIRDPNGLIFEKCFEGAEALIHVKYSPDGNTNFEVFSCDGQIELQIDNVPWMLENNGQKPHSFQKHPSELVHRNKSPHLNNTLCFYGLCIEVDKRNPAYNQKHRGSEKRCNNLFSLNGGVCRSLGSAHVKVGQWYQHLLTDSAKPKRDKEPKSSSYQTIMATKFINVRPPVPTMVVDGQVRVRVQFKYDDINFESKENSKLSHWSDRYQGMNETSEFWNEFVGKVEIKGKEALEIVQSVERYRAGLSAEKQLDQVTVVVTVVPRTDISWQHHEYPKDGAFRVKSLDKLKNGRNEVIADYRQRH